MQRATTRRATAEELAPNSSGRALVTSNASVLTAAAATATAAAAAAAAAPAVASLALGCVEPQRAQQQTSASPASAEHLGAEQQQQRESSRPLVLNGRVRYTFATRTAEETEQRSAPSSGSRDIASSSSSSSRVKDVGAANETGALDGDTTVVPDFNSCLKAGCSVVWRNNGGDTCDLASSAAGSKRIASPGSSSCGSRCSAPGVLRPAESNQAKDFLGSNSSSGSGAHHESRVPDNRDASSSIGSKSPSEVSSSNGSSRQKQQLPPVVAPDIAVLIRDFATFVQRVERQLQQLQQLQQQQFVGEGEGEQQQEELKAAQQQLRWSQAAPWGDQSLASGGRLRQQQMQEQEQHQMLQQQQWLRQHLQQREDCGQLLRSVSQGAVVCRSLHARLSSLLLEPAAAAAAVNVGGNELLLAKLRRDFSQQQQQYTRLLRLLDSFAEVLHEASKTTQQRQVGEAVGTTSSSSRKGSSSEAAAAVASEPLGKARPPAKKGAPARILWHNSSSSGIRRTSGSFPRGIEFDFTHFCYPRTDRRIDSILWTPDRERFLIDSGGVVGLPRLLIGPSLSSGGLPAADTPFERRTSGGGFSQEARWEPAALLEVDEDYEKRQILNERKEQLQQLRQVELCVSVLREMQLHAAENVIRGEELLCAAEEQTEAAADHTAAGAVELAAAARSRSRWWGVKGGGAAALLGVSLGAVAGGPIGAAVGAVVGAVAGVSSGAALRVRHRERVTALERSVRRRRAQHRLKRSSVAAADTVSSSRLVSANNLERRSSQAPPTDVRAEGRGSRPANVEEPSHPASGAPVLNDARSQLGGKYELGRVTNAGPLRSEVRSSSKNVDFKPSRGSLREAVRGNEQQERSSRAVAANAKAQPQQAGKGQHQRSDQARSGAIGFGSLLHAPAVLGPFCEAARTRILAAFSAMWQHLRAPSSKLQLCIRVHHVQKLVEECLCCFVSTYCSR
ncbi:hypothetical protein Esti_000983 [Eimeria stiedai]